MGVRGCGLGGGFKVQERYVGWSEGPKQLNLESLRVHDRIKSKLGSDHCSPNILSYI